MYACTYICMYVHIIHVHLCVCSHGCLLACVEEWGLLQLFVINKTFKIFLLAYFYDSKCFLSWKLLPICRCRNFFLLATTKLNIFLKIFRHFVEKGKIGANVKMQNMFACVCIVLKLCILTLSRFLGHGLLSILDYDTWKPRRKLYDPVFNKRSSICILHFGNDLILCHMLLFPFYVHLFLVTWRHWCHLFASVWMC